MTDHPSAFPRRQRLAAALLCLPLAWASVVQAQTLRASPQLIPLRGAIGATGPQTADFIVALVNSEPVTNTDVRQRLLRVEQQLTQQGAALPARPELARQVLEQLISERAQIQYATETGLRADEASLNQAEQAIAAQNQLTLEEFRRRVAAEGVDINRLRNDLRSQILLQRVQEREVESRVKVTESDIDSFIREKQNSNDTSNLQLNLAQVLVAVPEGASDERVKAAQARAQTVVDRARKGDDFTVLAREFSEAPEAASGGAFGLRTTDRLPGLFVEATKSLRAGEVAGPVRSPAGFHVLKVLEKRQGGLPDVVVTQTRARHILLRLNPQLSADAASERLRQYRSRILAGTAKFADLAREHSQDGSAREGGDLGWANPGQFVPEFEEVMNQLKPGEISQPLVSRFGVHLIQVDERRDSQLTQRDQREIVRGLLRDQKGQSALANWMQDIRARAYVEYRDAPAP
jgi:peptidyl-prolyl cis-trans isomerase SurA